MSIVAGAAMGLALWVLIVPWDLSEVDSEGRSIPGGGDDSGLFVGRTSVSRVSGANLWAASFILFVVPAVAVAWAVLYQLSRRLELRRLPPPVSPER